MKHLGVVLGLMIVSACGSEPAESSAPDATDPAGADGTGDETLSVDGISSCEMLGVCPGVQATPRGQTDDLANDDAAKKHRPAPAPSRIRRAIVKAGFRLADLQADTIGDNARNGLVDTDPDDGGWDFTLPAAATAHTATKSPTNLFGNTALAAFAAVEVGDAGNRVLSVALDAGIAMQRDPDIDSPPDFVFGPALARLADNPGFAQIGREHYDAKKAASGGAMGLGTLIRDSRHARNEDGLIPYDLGWLALGAAALDDAFPGNGYDADADLYAGLVVDDLNAAMPRFDIKNTSEAFYVTGLSWAQVSAAWVDDRRLFRDIRRRLLDEQKANGAWGTSAAQPADDLQSTAHALQTIAITDRVNARSRLAVRRAGQFFLRNQAQTGGWPDASNIELPLVDADIVLGLALARGGLDLDDVAPGTPLLAAIPGPAAPRATPMP